MALQCFKFDKHNYIRNYKLYVNLHVFDYLELIACLSDTNTEQTSVGSNGKPYG